MPEAYYVTGQLTDHRHVSLDEPIPLPLGKVRVLVERVSAESKPDLAAFERQLRERQATRGHVPRTKEEIDAFLNAERNSWDL